MHIVYHIVEVVAPVLKYHHYNRVPRPQGHPVSVSETSPSLGGPERPAGHGSCS
jgi:hypothetical protein